MPVSLTVLSWAAVIAGAGPGQPATTRVQPSREQRMAWWTEARFGMFLCWAPAAGLADGWGGWHLVKGGSWKSYDAQVEAFNPTEFDPARIAKLARQMGARYVVFTAKHHGGFSMWDTQQTDYKVTHTPYGQDVLAMLCDALRKEGLRVGVYCSRIDFHRFEFRGVPRDAPGLDKQVWGVTDKQGNPHWPKFLDFYFAQLDELLSHYGRIDVLWLDGWPRYEPVWQPDRFYELVRRRQPAVVLNNRWGDPSRSDFLTPETRIPPKDYGRAWETCMTSNGPWYYRPGGYRTPKILVRMLIDCVSKNGNFLLNFAPNVRGSFDADAVACMKGIGRWMTVNGPSIYGCGAAPLRAAPWGRATYKPGHLYLHLYTEPCDPGRPILIEGIESEIVSATLLATSQRVQMARRNGDTALTLPDKFALDPIATVVDLKVAEPLKIAPDFIRGWQVLGPLAGHTRPGGATYARPIGPEGRVDTRAPLVVDGRQHRWRPLAARPDGYVDLAALGDADNAVAFAAVDVMAPRPCRTRLLWGSSDRCTLYLNGNEVARTSADPVARPDADRPAIELPAGRSTLVAKLYNYHGGPFGFYAWIAGARRLDLRFEGPQPAAWLGDAPASWAASPRAIVIEAETARLRPGSTALDHRPLCSGGKTVRLRPAQPFDAGGFVASFDAPAALHDAWALIRYGASFDTEVSLVLDGGKPVRAALQDTTHPRVYRSALARLGDVPAGRHTLHVYTSRPTGAFHLDAIVLAEGEPAGRNLHVK